MPKAMPSAEILVPRPTSAASRKPPKLRAASTSGALLSARSPTERTHAQWISMYSPAHSTSDPSVAIGMARFGERTCEPGSGTISKPCIANTIKSTARDQEGAASSGGAGVGASRPPARNTLTSSSKGSSLSTVSDDQTQALGFKPAPTMAANNRAANKEKACFCPPKPSNGDVYSPRPASTAEVLSTAEAYAAQPTTKPAPGPNAAHAQTYGPPSRSKRAPSRAYVIATGSSASKVSA